MHTIDISVALLQGVCSLKGKKRLRLVNIVHRSQNSYLVVLQYYICRRAEELGFQLENYLEIQTCVAHCFIMEGDMWILCETFSGFLVWSEAS